MPDLLAGTTVRGLDTPPTVTDEQSASFDFTITDYGTASTGGTYVDCAVVFTAPTTGRVLLAYASTLLNSSTNTTAITPVVREGGTVGSGAEVVGADDDNRISMRDAGGSPNDQRAGVHLTVTGLTPGNTYNARLEHKVSGSTGTASRRSITATPAT